MLAHRSGGEAFFRETGIKPTDWYGRHWARWGDALQEAGFSPNEMQAAFSEDDLIRKYVSLIQELGHFPVEGEVRLKARSDPTFPSHSTFGRLGPKRGLAAKNCRVRRASSGWGSMDVASLCRKRAQSAEEDVRTPSDASAPEPTSGSSI